MDDWQKNFKSVAPLLTEGIQLAVIVVVFFFIGFWVDEKWNLNPWGKVVFVLVGSFGGIFKFIKDVLEISKNENKDN